MAFLPSLSTKELHRYHRVVTGSVDVRSHFEVLAWLQGDMQRYLPHQSNVRSSGTGGGVENDAAETASVPQLQCQPSFSLITI